MPVWRSSEAYMTYRAYATGEKTPKLKTTKKKADSESSPKTKSTQAYKGKRIQTLAKGDKPTKKKSKIQTHSSHASGLGDGVDIQSKVPDEQPQTVSGTNEGAGEDDEENDEHDSENDNDNEDDDQENVSGENESDDDGDDFVHPNLSTYKADDQEEEKADDDNDVFSDQKVSTPPDYEITEEEENQEDDDNVMGGEQEDEEDEELYRDLNLNLDRRDAEMMDAQVNQEKEEVHVTFTTELLVVQQQSSYFSSDLVSKFMNPTPDTSIDSILNPNVQSDIHVNVSVSITTATPSSDTAIPQTPIPFIQPQQQTHDSTTTTTIPTTTLPNIPDFASLFALSSILGIVDNYLASKMKDEVNVTIQLQSNKIREEAQAENEEFLNQIDSNIKAIIKDQVKAQVSKILPKVEKYVTESLGDKDLFDSYGDVVTLKRGRDDQDKDEEPFTGSNRGTKRRRSGKEESSKEAIQKESKSTSSSKDADARLWNLPGSQTPDREWNKTKTINDRPPQSWMTQLAQASGTQSSFNEFLATLIDFSAFIMNRLKINNLTQDVLTGPTYDLMKGTCKSVVELEYHLEENARGHQVIPFDHFINNDLEYLKGGSLSQRYTTSITKAKAAEYGNISLGPKHQSFYGYATNMETSKDVYSRHKIIVVTSLKIMEFFGYKHLEEITVRRQDDRLYKFREGDFKRLCRQDIEDMLLLLVQGKLTN
ncbi:hypothetical protein Tco_0102952 [Tanacetum coccineum]